MPTLIQYEGDAHAGIRVDCVCEKCKTPFSYVHYYKATHIDSFQSGGAKYNEGYFKGTFFPKFKKKLELKVTDKRDKKMKKGLYGMQLCPSCQHSQSWMKGEVARMTSLVISILAGFIALIAINVFFTENMKKLLPEVVPFWLSVIFSLGFSLLLYWLIRFYFSLKKTAQVSPQTRSEPALLNIHFCYPHGMFGAISHQTGYGTLTDYIITEKVPFSKIKNSQWKCPICGTMMPETENKCSKCDFFYLIKSVAHD